MPAPQPTRGALRTGAHWALVLGAVGFAAGFLGPMALDPEANIGPLVGILFTGPGGAAGGFVLGLLAATLVGSEAARGRALAAASVVWAGAILASVLPQPAVRGYVIDAQVESCGPPAQAVDAAAARWEEALQRVTWARPPADWKERAIRNVEEDPGVLLTVRIHRQRVILRHRRPWDRGRTSAGPWTDVNAARTYYGDGDAGGCAAWLARDRALYWPFADRDAHPGVPSRVWPPVDPLGFLGLQTLGPVPAEYARAMRSAPD